MVQLGIPIVSQEQWCLRDKNEPLDVKQSLNRGSSDNVWHPIISREQWCLSNKKRYSLAFLLFSRTMVLSQRTCSRLGKTTFVSLFHFRGSSFVNFFAFFNTKHYSTDSGNELFSSKRRSREPVMASKKVAQGGQQEEGRYKHTVDLPKTTFGMRANSSVREPEIQKLWEEKQVFKRVSDKNDGRSFVLHDGPPYANGDLHIGHALNKILKDIINRYKAFLESLDYEARKDLTPFMLRAKAATFAKATVKSQMTALQRYGVWADWSNPYLTLDPEYEAARPGSMF
ncbi:hypothetical protein ACFE04_007520 [Oxalis oulophora]